MSREGDALRSGLQLVREPGGQVGRALEIEQVIGEGFQLLQRQRLDLNGGIGGEGAAAAVEEAEGHIGFPFLPTLCKPILSSAGVAQFFVGDTSNHPMESGD